MCQPRSRSFRAVFPSAIALLFLGMAGAAHAGTPVAHFTYAPPSPTAGAAVQFTDTSTETPTSWLWDFGDPAAGALNASTVQNPAFTYNLPGTYTVTLRATNNDGSSTTSQVLTVAPGTALCQDSPQQLCLLGRFTVSADFVRTDGSTGNGTAIKLTDESGYFWFFTAGNVELVVKVLNGCIDPFNSYWVFAAGLTNVSVILNVTDQKTNDTFHVTTDAGPAFFPIQSTSAFPNSCP